MTDHASELLALIAEGEERAKARDSSAVLRDAREDLPAAYAALRVLVEAMDHISAEGSRCSVCRRPICLRCRKGECDAGIKGPTTVDAATRSSDRE